MDLKAAKFKNRTGYPLINPSAGNFLKRLKCKRKSETPNEENFNKIIALEPPTEPEV